jgi:hypothetical protein
MKIRGGEPLFGLKSLCKNVMKLVACDTKFSVLLCKDFRHVFDIAIMKK